MNTGVRHWIDPKDLRKWVRQGKSLKWMAEKVGCSTSTITRHLRKLGVGNHSGVRYSKTYRVSLPKYRLRDYVRNGFTDKRIADETGLSEDRIGALVREFGLTDMRCPSGLVNAKTDMGPRSPWWHPVFVGTPKEGEDFWWTIAYCIRDGWPMREIIETFGVADTSVRIHFPLFKSTHKRTNQLKRLDQQLEDAYAMWERRYLDQK